MLRLVLFFVSLVYLVSAVEEICPGYGYVMRPENCIDQCNDQFNQCPKGTKCCYQLAQPCGLQCIKPKLKYLKAGECPKSLTVKENPNWFLCDAHLCDVDYDCPHQQKCCSNTCGANVCLNPLL